MKSFSLFSKIFLAHMIAWFVGCSCSNYSPTKDDEEVLSENIDVVRYCKALNAVKNIANSYINNGCLDTNVIIDAWGEAVQIYTNSCCMAAHEHFVDDVCALFKVEDESSMTVIFKRLEQWYTCCLFKNRSMLMVQCDNEFKYIQTVYRIKNMLQQIFCKHSVDMVYDSWGRAIVVTREGEAIYNFLSFGEDPNDVNDDVNGILVMGKSENDTNEGHFNIWYFYNRTQYVESGILR